MDETRRILENLGFSSYQSKAFLALLRRHPMNGYELSKLSGIPTSKIYGVLAELKNGGFVVSDESSRPLRYDPIPLDDLSRKLRSAYDSAIGYLEEELRRVAPLPDLALSWNLADYGSVLGKISELLGRAEASAMLSVWPEELELLRADIEGARARGVKLVVGTFGKAEGLGPLALDISGCGGSSRRRIGSRLTVAAADMSEVVISEIVDEERTVGLWTRSREIALVAREYMRHDIWGRALIDELGEEAFKALCQQSELLSYLIDNE